jgi:Flp pilus assembly pilin Flp
MMDRLIAWATMLTARLEGDEGQTFVEYALVLTAVVVGVLLTVTMTGLGTAIQNAVTQVSNAIAG